MNFLLSSLCKRVLLDNIPLKPLSILDKIANSKRVLLDNIPLKRNCIDKPVFGVRESY